MDGFFRERKEKRQRAEMTQSEVSEKESQKNKIVSVVIGPLLGGQEGKSQDSDFHPTHNFAI